MTDEVLKITSDLDYFAIGILATRRPDDKFDSSRYYLLVGH